jgi:16S rRNA (guanine527-N7)-methyltransferase
MQHIPDEQILRALQPFGLPITGELCDQIRTYMDLLLRWNRRISLTTITEPQQILRFHFGESFLAVPTVPIRHGRLADVGSGAGFPAVPLRMASSEILLTLIESNHKKSAFLAEVVRELKLSGVDIYTDRMERLGDDQLRFDFVTARAVAIENPFLDWISAHLNCGGSVVLWLGQDDSEQVSLTKPWRWRNPIKIPGSDRRAILVGSKPNE